MSCDRLIEFTDESSAKSFHHVVATYLGKQVDSKFETSAVLVRRHLLGHSGTQSQGTPQVNTPAAIMAFARSVIVIMYWLHTGGNSDTCLFPHRCR